MAGIKIDPEMLDIYLESLNKLMAGSETDGGNARLEVSGAASCEYCARRLPFCHHNEEVNKLGDDLRELYGNVGEILGRIRDGTLEADIYGAESIKAEAVTEKWSDLGW